MLSPGRDLASIPVVGDVVVPTAQDPQEPHAFTVAVAPDRREVAVVPRGELDLATVEALENEVCELRDAGFEEIVVDLRRLSFMDSTGLALLVTLRNDAMRTGYRLTLRPGPPSVQRVFAITGTRGLFRWGLGRGAPARAQRSG